MSGINLSRSKEPESLKVRLQRIDKSDQGSFGKLTVVGTDFTCFTGELPWRHNSRNVSCIPEGVYTCKWTRSPRFNAMMYLVESVPNRGGIRLHAANLMGDISKGLKAHLNGCIALGERLGLLDGQKALLVSKPAHRRFEEVMQGRDFTLEIV